MAAEVLGQQFTQMGNQAARDRRLTRRAKGLLVELLSHRDGYGISVAALVAAGPEGRDAIRATLNELEEHGYLHRVQARDGQGRISETVYEITDMPESTPEMETRRSEPAPEKPAPGSPAPVNPPHKKTIPLQEDQLVEDELSLPPVPAQRTAGSTPAEREIVTPIDRPSTAQQVVRAANLLTSNDDETAFITWATARYRIRSGALWRTVATNGDLTDWVATWRAEGSQAVAHGLTGTDATVMGWMALADQLSQDGGAVSKPSVTDQRVQHALDLGRRMQAEADARRGGGYRPQNPNDAWAYIEQQAAAGERPDGWELVLHCGHPDCDETTRMREVEDVHGARSATYCTRCHPALNF